MNIDIGLSSEALDSSNDILLELLADSFVVYFKTHTYHWNIEGPDFFELHEEFENEYKTVASHIDIIAERIRVFNIKPMMIVEIQPAGCNHIGMKSPPIQKYQLKKLMEMLNSNLLWELDTNIELVSSWCF